MEDKRSTKPPPSHICHYADCLKAFSKPSRLLIHLRTHTGERPFVCTLDGCDKSYVRKSHLDRHYDTAHQNQVSITVTCMVSGCNKVFASTSALNKHNKSVHSEIGKYKCPEENCDKSFNKRHQLRAHSFEHFGVLPFQCDIDGCNKQFKQSSHLLRHKEFHKRTYICDENGCKERFSKWSQFRKHKSESHKKLHICNICGKQFPRPILLSKHKEHHNEENNKQMVKCPYNDCERKYQDVKNLRAHVRSYHKERKLFCSYDDCKRSFVNRAKLNHHIKAIHCAKKSVMKKYPKKGHRRLPMAIKLMKQVVNTESPISALSIVEERLSDISENNDNVDNKFIVRSDRECKDIKNKDKTYEFDTAMIIEAKEGNSKELDQNQTDNNISSKEQLANGEFKKDFCQARNISSISDYDEVKNDDDFKSFPISSKESKNFINTNLKAILRS